MQATNWKSRRWWDGADIECLDSEWKICGVGKKGKLSLLVFLGRGVLVFMLNAAVSGALADQLPSTGKGTLHHQATAAVAALTDLKHNESIGKARFTVVKGKGWSVCEHYARLLNSQPGNEPLPLCHLKLGSELKEPDWETLDIQSHLHTIYSIEYPPYRNAINPDKPPPPFDRWIDEFKQRQKDGQAPRLRRTYLALVEDGPMETILAYEADRDRCDKMVKDKGYSHNGGGVELVLWDERHNKIDGYRSMLTFTASPAQLLLFQGKPFMFWTFWGNMSATPKHRFEGRIGVHHFLFIPSASDPYGHSERCQIGFDLPSNIVERMTK
jgi:hypothetical protein